MMSLLNERNLNKNIQLTRCDGGTTTRPVVIMNMTNRTHTASYLRQDSNQSVLVQMKNRVTGLEEKDKSFPLKLMDILEEPNVSDSIVWLPHGDAFMIVCQKKFTMEVLPKYFIRSQFSSFTRKLYWWGFKKCSKAKYNIFYHEFFRRGDYLLCAQMKGRKYTKRNEHSQTHTSFENQADKKYERKNVAHTSDCGERTMMIRSDIVSRPYNSAYVPLSLYSHDTNTSPTSNIHGLCYITPIVPLYIVHHGTTVHSFETSRRQFF